MDYSKIYNQLIERGRQRTFLQDGYGEKHHIVPKCMGGSDDISNLVKLTAREHFIAHLLLCKVYPNQTSLLFAFNCMCNKWGEKGNVKRDYIVKNSCVYERLRIELRNQLSEMRSGEKNPMYGKPAYNRGVPASEETRKKLSKRFSGEGNPMYGKKRPKYIGEAVAKANKERVWTEDSKCKLSESLKGENNPWYGKKIPITLKRKNLASKCLRVLQTYDSNKIDPALWNMNSRKAFTSKTILVCGLSSVITYFGNFENMLDFVNSVYNTNYIPYYPDIFSLIIQEIRFDKQSPANMSIVFNSMLKLLPIFIKLYDKDSETLIDFISFLENSILKIKLHLELKDVYRGGSKFHQTKIENLWFYPKEDS